jgi:hypothetical protein
MPVAPDSSGLGYSQQQLQNAATIVAVGKGRGMSDNDIVTALMVALDESGLRNYANSTVPASLNLPHQAVGHDTDSLGLFQQRPSAGWGTIDQLMTPSYAAGKFYDTLKKKVPNRANVTPWAAAQAVQVSAYADGSNYHAQYDNAVTLYKALGNTVTPIPDSATGTTSTSTQQGWSGGLTTALGFLTAPASWKRIGMFAAGGILVGGALIFVVAESNTVKSAVSTGKNVAGKAAAAAAIVAP